MRHLLVSLCLGVAFIGCEKAPSRHSSHARPDAETPSERFRHAIREPEQGSPYAERSAAPTAPQIPMSAEQTKAMADVVWNAMETDPLSAHEAFLRLPTGSPEKLRLIRHYAMSLAESDLEAALEWAEALDSEEETTAAKVQIALTLAEADPHRAAEMLSESGSVGREFDVAVVQVIQRWAAKSPAEAAAWVSEFPQGDSRSAGIKLIVERWLVENAAAAFAWYSSLRDPRLRAEAALGLEEAILQKPQDVRDAWRRHADAAIMSDLERQHEETLKNVGDNLPAADP
jgi:hypothetical protein